MATVKAPLAVSHSTNGSINFLKRLPLYETEKPYSIQYYPHGDVPRSNVEQQTVTTIKIDDVRPWKDQLDFDRDGFIVSELNSDLSPEEFADPAKVRDVYLEEVKAILSEIFRSKNVAIVEYLVRRRHQSFPAANGEDFEYAQPVATAHIDFSPDCLVEMIHDRYAHRAHELLKHRYRMVNVWKPLRGPLKDWPLALCRPSSLSPGDDYQPMDRVYPQNIEESIQIHYSPNQEWSYLSNQLDSEVLVFRGGDSAVGMTAGVPHCSFEIGSHNSLESIRPRESVEVRALVFDSSEELDLDSVAPSRRHGPASYKLKHHQES